MVGHAAPTDLHQVSGAGPFYCTKTADGWTHAFSMTVQQTGEELLVTRIKLDSPIHEGLSVPGHVGIDGAVTFSDVTLLGEEESTRILSQWAQVAVGNPTLPTISGSVQLDEIFEAIGGLQHYRNMNFISIHR
jgi:hypothetical protein